jgi:hypothetical protein
MSMVDAVRKKSPRAPSLDLQEALDRALKIYEKERRHPAPTDVVAQDMGYKSANSGKALSAMASLRYYGLLERSQAGQLAITKEVEAYRFDPSDSARRELLLRFVRNPPVFADLLDKYGDALPSDASLRFELVRRGFTPVAAESLISVFRRSAEFANYFDTGDERETAPAESAADEVNAHRAAPIDEPRDRAPPPTAGVTEISSEPQETGCDRIPVRLSHGRRAWLVIPIPFFESDKSRLKAQIDLILTDDEAE